MEKKIVKLMIDGNYTFHIHKYIKNFNKYIDWEAFKEFIKEYILRTENQVAQIVFDSKYFVGTEKHTTDADRDFLYNTLDSIAWMCEVGRTKEAIEMVNALARLSAVPPSILKNIINGGSKNAGVVTTLEVERE